jgi:hypothetical protein
MDKNTRTVAEHAAQMSENCAILLTSNTGHSETQIEAYNSARMIRDMSPLPSKVSLQ